VFGYYGDLIVDVEKFSIILNNSRTSAPFPRAEVNREGMIEMFAPAFTRPKLISRFSWLSLLQE
jgi:hypothetical protein